jgi:FtsZ-binding cell division protein ZapB
MGQIADAIRGCALPEQKKIKLLRLDLELTEMKEKVQSLQSENLRLTARVNPLEREVERLKSEEKRHAPREFVRLDELQETILIEIANHGPITRQHYVRQLKVSNARAVFCYDVLEEKEYVAISYHDDKGTWYVATPMGRKYLYHHCLL